MDPDDGFQTIETVLIFADESLALQKDTVLTPNRNILDRKIVKYRPSSAIVPVYGGGPVNKVLLMRHFRYPIGRLIWEIPGGIKRVTESYEDCAIRECFEETGYIVRDVTSLIRFFPEPAFTDHVLEVYAGMLDEDTGRQTEVSEEILEYRLFTFEEAMGMIRTGDIASSWSIIGLMMAYQQYKK